MRSACEQRQGDLADRDAVIAAARGCDAIFHNAAKAGAWGSYDSYHRANVVGTDNVIAACRAHGDRTARLHLDAERHPSRDASGRRRHRGHRALRRRISRPRTRRPRPIAEQAVLAANDAGLATIALRPRLIWGPGDQQLLPRLVRARARRPPAHRRPWRQPDRHHLHRQRRAGAPRCVRPPAAGRGAAPAARTSSATANPGLRARSSTRCCTPPARRRSTRRCRFALAYAIGAACEAAWTLLPLRGEPPLTRFLAEQLATTHWYDMAPGDARFRLRAAGDDRRRAARLAARAAD